MHKVWMQVLVTVLAIMCISCGGDLKDPDKEQKYAGPLIENIDVVTIYSDSAKVLVKLRAPVQQEFESGDAIFPKGFYIEFYENEKISSTLKANYGELNRRNNLYVARGNVVMKNIEKKESLETEELFWNQNTDRVYTDKFVKITTPERVLMGQGLETNQKFFPYSFHKVTGSFELSE
jgi:LPS export ABC transporter protein LptC